MIAKSLLAAHLLPLENHDEVLTNCSRACDLFRLKTLAASREGNESMLLTLLVNDRRWGLHRYEKDKNKPAVPEQARAESFVIDVGYFSSKDQAEELVAALK